MKKVQVFLPGLVFSFPLLFASFVAAPTPRSQAEPQNGSVRAIVNSNQDGAIAPDASLTLREAIGLVNGTLSLNQLSSAEKAQVKSLPVNTRSRIEFNLQRFLIE